MSKKTLAIIFVIVVLILGLVTLYSSLTREKALLGEEIMPKEFLPFGKPPPAVEEEGVPPRVPLVEIPSEEIEIEEVKEVVVPRLRKVATFAVAGFTIFRKTRPLEPEPSLPTPFEEKINFTGYDTLRTGSAGSQVKDLQVVLNRQILTPNLEINGIFDGVTRQAVIDFQTRKNLAADGIAGPKTFAALNEFQDIVGPEAELATTVRYVAKATGHVFEKFLDRNEQKEISITTIPRIHEAFFGNKGKSVILRFIAGDNQTIETFSGTLTAEQKLEGIFLAQNIISLNISPKGDKIFYLSKIDDQVVGIESDFNDNNKKQIFNSPFTEWLTQWVTKNKIVFTTKPSGVVPGFLYIFDTNTELLDKILGNINGLTTLISPSGKLVLYSESQGNDIFLWSYDIDQAHKTELGLHTLPEKCVWAPAGSIAYCAIPKFIEPNIYPDLWYQGMIFFSDSIFRINTKTGVSDIIIDPLAEINKEMDIIKLILSPKEDYLLFINKKDSILWSYELK